MKKTSIILFLGLLNISLLFGQGNKSYDFQQLLQQLEWELIAGNKWALRDLGTLLDKQELKPKIIDLLQENTLFRPEEIEISSSLDKQTFLDFYYTYEDSLDFSIVSDVFYLTPPHQQKVTYKIIKPSGDEIIDVSSQLRSLVRSFEVAVKNQKSKNIIASIEKLGAIENREAYEFLLSATKENFKQIAPAPRQKIYQAFFESLINYRENNCLVALLQLVKDQRISKKIAAPYLTKLTNISVTEDGNFEDIAGRYQHLIDSLHSLNGMIKYGYKKLFPFQASFFSLPVDYYGRILSDNRRFSWIRHNAIADLAESQHPRALYYLAAQVYKFRERENQMDKHDLNKYVQLVNKLTGQEISFGGSVLDLVNTPEVPGDYVAKRHLLVYWARHHTDYEWDPNHQVFINKLEAAEITQNYEKLFRRLPSRNDSVAFAAFMQLTEGEPGEIMELAQKYRQLLRNYNDQLPSFKYQFLEQLTLLTDYCRRNNFSYRASDNLDKLLNQLYSSTSPKERYHLENKIIGSLKLKEVTAVEYWACLRANKSTFNFSVGRILDRFYSKHWNKIIAEEDQLRLYLKKSYLFENIGVLGICNAYLRKFDINDPTIQNTLNTLVKAETDNEIGNQIMQLIDQPEIGESFGLEDFLEDPLSFSRREIKILPTPNEAESERIVEMMRNSEALDLVKILFYYLRLHPAIEEVPYLFTLIDDDRVLSDRKGKIITVVSNIIPIIEDVYSYHYPPDTDITPTNQAAWKKHWVEDQANYKNWGAFFFEQKIQQLALQEELDIEDINLITESPYFQEQHKEACLTALQKVVPVKNIKRLNIEPKLSAKDDLKYFMNIDFSYKELDDIPKLFQEDDPREMINFIMKKSLTFEVSNRGSFFNNLFRAPWFAAYINSGKADAIIAKGIRKTLLQYLEESEFISEFEEQTTNFNISQIEAIGMPLKDRLEAATNPDMEEGSRIKIQESIIATVSYQEIGTVLQYIDQLTVKQGLSPFQFLHKDFGLPIFELDNPQEIIKRHSSLDEFKFYSYYLDDFGVNYKNAKGDIDFQKIYDILQFDIVSPFVGEDGGKRDDYTYGIIKLLELTFGERLGFHEKLNENQTFYAFSSSKRANAWMKYLEEQGYVAPKEVIPTSYNLVREMTKE